MLGSVYNSLSLRGFVKIFNVMFSKVNGGLEQVFLNYIPALASQGNEMISIIHPKAQIRGSCPEEGLKTLHNFNQYDLLAIWRLRKLIQREKPDCIITHSYRAAYLVKKTRTRVPTVAVCHVRSHYNFGTTAIIAITEHMRQEIIRAGQPANQVFTIPNMLRLPETLSYRSPKPSPVPVIGVCARFAAIKGVDIFIRALAELKKRGLSFNAKIAGDGKERETYEQLITALELNDSVTLLGWVEDKASFYNSIDIFCLPSREEAFGLVVLEAMMHSLPMVLARLSGPEEIIGQSNSALLVPPCDPEKMADGLEQLIRNPQLAQELSLNAFKQVQNYSNEAIGPKLHDVLEKIRLMRN